MEYRIVTDSSANVFALSGAALTSVPLKIVTDEKEYVDDPALDVDGMISELQRLTVATISAESANLIRHWQSTSALSGRMIRMRRPTGAELCAGLASSM